MKSCSGFSTTKLALGHNYVETEMFQLGTVILTVTIAVETRSLYAL